MAYALKKQREFWTILFIIFLSFYGCSAFAGKDDLGPPANQAKIDPAIKIDLEALKSGENPDRKISVLIRTEKELTAGQRAALEKEGAEISSTMGNVLSAKVRLGSVENISRLGFVTYIEKAKKQRLR